ncbi:hypothetical protein FAUST_6237 [Fusarium austroamericanum]|uniref:Uncharacterized protein n=1 Tax=Fusarium austroamericanum TaxID=282268 RepID=A0AAN5Z8Y4_FUSAU|nr:hypothetical protein FAUST_6237 [Fusarium austroamericanum]
MGHAIILRECRQQHQLKLNAMLKDSNNSQERWDELKDADPPYLGRWGFTIYRTYYGPGSDENWDTLLKKAKEETFEALLEEDHDDIAAKICPLFQLDARSDPALLDGLSLGDLCKIYHDKVGGEPMPWYRSPVFLAAEEHVLNDIGEGNLIVKYVDADEPPREEVPLRTNTTEAWWGWSRMELRQIFELWSGLVVMGIRFWMCSAVHQADLDDMIWEGNDAG